MIKQERLVKEFLQMVQIDSISKQEGEFSAYLQGKLAELGLEVLIDEKAGQLAGANTGNLVTKVKGKKEKAPTILLAAHLDTVVPGKGIKPQIKDGVIYSSGDTVLGSDNKAGIAIILEVLRHLQEEKVTHGDLEILFTICEEIGLLGSRYLDYGLVNAKMGFVLDSDGAPGTIIRQGPVHENIKAVIHGRAAHAGMQPEKGVSAIQVAAKAINRMNLLRIDEETTANIGIIRGGGATNIVCDHVELEGEVRSLSEDKLHRQIKHIIDCLQEKCTAMGAQLTVVTERSYPAFSLQENESVVVLARQAAETLGLPARITSSGGGSDTNYLNNNGIKTVNLGIGMTKAHTREESIRIEDLVMAAKYVAEIVQII